LEIIDTVLRNDSFYNSLHTLTTLRSDLKQVEVGANILTVFGAHREEFIRTCKADLLNDDSILEFSILFFVKFYLTCNYQKLLRNAVESTRIGNDNFPNILSLRLTSFSYCISISTSGIDDTTSDNNAISAKDQYLLCVKDFAELRKNDLFQIYNEYNRLHTDCLSELAFKGIPGMRNFPLSNYQCNNRFFVDRNHSRKFSKIYSTVSLDSI
jgi:hypothetical protein